MAKKAKKKRVYFKYRRTVQIFSLVFLLAVPFLNLVGIHFFNGWYQSLGVGYWFIASPLESFESFLISRTFFLTLFVSFLTPFLLALILGRVFCSWLCPFGLLSEWVSDFRQWIYRKWLHASHPPEGLFRVPRWIVWIVLTAEISASLMVGTSLFSIYSPPGVIGREAMRLAFFHIFGGEILFILIFLTLELFVVRRGFCRYVCPLGASLSLLGEPRKLRVELTPSKCASICRVCDNHEICTWGLMPKLGEGNSIYCTNCGDCIDICPFDALKFVWKSRQSVADVEKNRSVEHGNGR